MSVRKAFWRLRVKPAMTCVGNKLLLFSTIILQKAATVIRHGGLRPALSGSIFLFLAACQKESERSPCLETKDAALRMKVSQIVDTNIVDSSLRSAVLIPIGGTGGLRYTAATATPQLYLSTLADSCRYALLTDSTATLADTLFFNYTRQLRYISDACGYGYTFTLTNARASGTFIDSVLIRNTVVNTNVNSPAHVQIYLRP